METMLTGSVCTHLYQHNIPSRPAKRSQLDEICQFVHYESEFHSFIVICRRRLSLSILNAHRDGRLPGVHGLEHAMVDLLEEQAPLRPRTKLQKSIGDLGCFDVPLSFLCFCISLRAILTEMKIVESLRKKIHLLLSSNLLGSKD